MTNPLRVDRFPFPLTLVRREIYCVHISRAIPVVNDHRYNNNNNNCGRLVRRSDKGKVENNRVPASGGSSRARGERARGFRTRRERKNYFRRKYTERNSIHTHTHKERPSSDSPLCGPRGGLREGAVVGTSWRAGGQTAEERRWSRRRGPVATTATEGFLPRGWVAWPAAAPREGRGWQHSSLSSFVYARIVYTRIFLTFNVFASPHSSTSKTRRRLFPYRGDDGNKRVVRCYNYCHCHYFCPYLLSAYDDGGQHARGHIQGDILGP